MLIVRTYDDYTQALAFINQSEFLAYDVETTGLNPRKDKIIGFGVSNGLDGFYVPLWRWEITTGELVSTSVMDNSLHLPILQALQGKQLLMFNASFDARFTKYNFQIDLVPALHTDILLLKHCISEDYPFKLKEIAASIFGPSALEDQSALKSSIKSNGGTEKQYFKADMEVIAKYCVSDCLLTYKLYNFYNKQLDADLKKFFYDDEVMPLLKTVTTEMEETGVVLDMPKIQKALEEITQDLKEVERTILNIAEPLVTQFIKDYLGREYPLMTPKGNPTKLGKRMVVNGFTDEFRMQAGAWRAANPDAASIFNLNSKHHLKALFFDILKETPISKTPKGAPKVDEEFLELMGHKYDWAAQLIIFNKLQKLRSTYMQRFIDESEDGIFYPQFLQHRTVSGRYGSDFQQLPKPLKSKGIVAKYTNQIRSFIIARPGHHLVSADYEQLEPTIFAHVSKDPALQDIFNNGKDFYSEVCIRTEKLQGFSSDKNAPNYLKTINEAKRDGSKEYALGIAYGETGFKLKFVLGIDQAAADQLVDSYWLGFPKLAEVVKQKHHQTMTQGFVKSEAGRVRHMPQAVKLRQKYGPSILHDLELWKAYHQNPPLYEKAKSDRRVLKNLLNNAVNFPVQSLAASIVNRAAIALYHRLRLLSLKGRFVAQVHDQLLLEVPDAEIQATKIPMQEIMETNYKLSVPLKARPIAARSFDACK